MITHIARIPTKNLGGQKQLISNPTAKTMAIKPLFVLLPFLRIFIPPILHNKQNLNFCYKTQEKGSVLNKNRAFYYLIILSFCFAQNLNLVKSINYFFFGVFGK